MTINEVPFGSKLFDTYAAVSSAMAYEAKRQGFDGVVRYINSITKPEIDVLHAAGLGVMLVTYCRAAGWTPTRAEGVQDGAAHAAKVYSLGLSGVTIYHDIEGVNPKALPKDLCDFHDAWANQQSDPGVYVGAGGLLTGREWYARPYTRHYWKGLSDVRDRSNGVVQPDCDWSMIQLYDDITLGKQRSILGVPVDVSFVQKDFRLRLPNWLAP